MIIVVGENESRELTQEEVEEFLTRVVEDMGVTFFDNEGFQLKVKVKIEVEEY